MKRHLIAAGMGMLLVTACANDDDNAIDETLATLEPDPVESGTDGEEIFGDGY